MFERLNTPEELYNYKLGAALKMEQTVLEMLDDNAQAAQSPDLERLFRHHQDETREQVANLEKGFAAFGWEVDDSPCPAIEGIGRRASPTLKGR
jgi:ferritin-like metal-binding protein YciE